MEIKTFITKNEDEYQLVNEYWETRNSWGHKTTIIRNGVELDSYKVRYYNRTWESYQYQSSMKNAIKNELEDMEKYYIKREKERKGIYKLSSIKKAELLNDFSQFEIVKGLNEIYEQL